ncbi:conserved hypothetical protein [metagenome]|uniref:DAC domain-containing protein n=1 Tax=metagenome TaxID=256318 RepID=A0A2P2CAT1_9ZZZZ
MGGSIVRFMWGHQRPFRSSIDRAAKEALRAIGADVDPVALLVGVRATDAASFDFCVEPEYEPIAATDLTAVLTRAQELYESDEGSRMFHTDAGVHRARQAALRDRQRGVAICEALGASEAGTGRTFFASRSHRIGEYEIYAVLGVLTHRWGALPALAVRRRDNMGVTPSLAEAVVRRVLDLASRAMALGEPPQSIAWDTDADTQAITRDAAHRFVESVALLSGQWFGTQLHEHLDAVAAQPYEGRTGLGTIVLAAGKAEEIDHKVAMDVSFEVPVEVRETRAFRKTLEMSGPDLHVLTDGTQIYGLGQIADGYDPATESAFEVLVVGRGSWELKHDGRSLLRVDNTRAHLPQERLSAERFADTVSRLFGEVDSVDVDALWELSQAASEQEHGTMLVVHRRASAEAHRLVPQAMVVAPVQLTRDRLRAITNIDGAVLVSPDAQCHAVGVILDGIAFGHGDPARGARYNSAVRYRHAAGDDCLVIIVSEDGMINLLPALNPRIQRERVEEAVVALEEAAAGEVNFEVFYRRRRHLDTLSFYLAQEQCVRVNASTKRVEDYRWEIHQMRVEDRELEPNPGMNDSYFL